jgi:glyoxylase-like metal-dependent hydrolase (beta-lactamase superfamily II)
MAAKLKILIEGCSNADSVAETGTEKTQPTVTLVKDDGIVMVVDPGTLESQQVLVDALKKENVSVEDVNTVCITHSHLDHYRNIGMFPNAKTLEFFGLWNKNTVDEWQEKFSTNIQIARTPGHDYTDITLFVTTNEGLVAICGDVFWKEDYPHDPEDDAFASDPAELARSRQMILKMADWVIPGHGPMFRVKKGMAADPVLRKKAEQKTDTFCKKCQKPLVITDKCLCRPWLCFKCCECDLDCETCSCAHRARTIKTEF